MTTYLSLSQINKYMKEKLTSYSTNYFIYSYICISQCALWNSGDVTPIQLWIRGEMQAILGILSKKRLSPGNTTGKHLLHRVRILQRTLRSPDNSRKGLPVISATCSESTGKTPRP